MKPLKNKIINTKEDYWALHDRKFFTGEIRKYIIIRVESPAFELIETLTKDMIYEYLRKFGWQR